jgi:hypothetical protein
MAQSQTHSAEAAILSRVIRAKGPALSPEAAKALLDLRFADEDRKRMHELAVRNQQGTLSPDDERELDSYVRVGRLLDMLSAQARTALKSTR